MALKELSAYQRATYVIEYVQSVSDAVLLVQLVYGCSDNEYIGPVKSTCYSTQMLTLYSLLYVAIRKSEPLMGYHIFLKMRCRMQAPKGLSDAHMLYAAAYIM